MKMRVAVIVAIAVSGFACAPAGQGGQSEPINDASAGEAGGQMASSIESGAGGFRRTNQPAPAMVGGTSGEGEFLPDFCLHLAAGQTWTDTDGDGNPSPAVNVDISCSFQGPDGSKVASGSIIFGDTAPSTPGFDASVEYNDIDVMVTGSANKYHITGNASDVNSGVALGGGAFELTHHEDADTRSEFLGLDDTLYGFIDERYVWDMVLDVTGFEPGNDAPGGTMQVDGEWSVHIRNLFEDIEHKSGTTVETVAPLQLDPTCGTNIVAGQVAASFDGEDGEANITVTWTGCGTHTITFNASS